jgi:signal peptidase I
MAGEERGVVARIGVLLLNIPAPGLSLLRLGQLRLGLIFMILGPALLVIVYLIAKTGTIFSPPAFLVTVIVMIAGVIVRYLGPLLPTWRSSRVRGSAKNWWQRWYAIAGVLLIYVIGCPLLAEAVRGQYRNFYIPSEAMHPTLETGMRFVADMRSPVRSERGDIIVFNVGNEVYVKRVVALPGDRVAMVGGVPVINDIAAVQRELPRRHGSEQATMLTERLPGSGRRHHILDYEPSMFDEMAEVTVPAGHVFVLGDNRDRSADSRVPREYHGVEMLPLSDIIGRARFRSWNDHYRWIGTPIE